LGSWQSGRIRNRTLLAISCSRRIVALGPSQSTDPAGHTSARPSPSQAMQPSGLLGWPHSTAPRLRCARIPDNGAGASNRPIAATPGAARGAPPAVALSLGRWKTCTAYAPLNISRRKKPVPIHFCLFSYAFRTLTEPCKKWCSSKKVLCLFTSSEYDTLFVKRRYLRDLARLKVTPVSYKEQLFHGDHLPALSVHRTPERCWTDSPCLPRLSTMQDDDSAHAVATFPLSWPGTTPAGEAQISLGNAFFQPWISAHCGVPLGISSFTRKQLFLL